MRFNHFPFTDNHTIPWRWVSWKRWMPKMQLFSTASLGSCFCPPSLPHVLYHPLIMLTLGSSIEFPQCYILVYMVRVYQELLPGDHRHWSVITETLFTRFVYKLISFSLVSIAMTLWIELWNRICLAFHWKLLKGFEKKTHGRGVAWLTSPIVRY